MKNRITTTMILVIATFALASCRGVVSDTQSSVVNIDETNPHFLKLDDARYQPNTDFDEPEALPIEEMSEGEYYAAFVNDIDDFESQDLETDANQVAAAEPHTSGLVQCVTPKDEDGHGGMDWDENKGCVCGYTADDQPIFLNNQKACP